MDLFLSNESYAIDVGDVIAATNKVESHVHRTPLMTSSVLDRLAQRRLLFKVEALQRTGSFKVRRSGFRTNETGQSALYASKGHFIARQTHDDNYWPRCKHPGAYLSFIIEY